MAETDGLNRVVDVENARPLLALYDVRDLEDRPKNGRSSGYENADDICVYADGSERRSFFVN